MFKLKFKLAGFTLLEILITLIILVMGVFSVTRAFTAGIFASSDIENAHLALNIAQAEMEEIKNTPFADLADNGPVPADLDLDSPFARFDVTVNVAENQDPRQIDVTVDWNTKGGKADVILTTLVTNF